MTLASKLFIALKTSKRPLDLVELFARTGIKPVELGTEIQKWVKKGLIDVKPGEKFVVRFHLNPPIRKSPQATGWSWERIQEEKGKTVELPKGHWISSILPYMPHENGGYNQAGIGSCVGFATAALATANYFVLTQDLPQKADIEAQTRDNQLNIGGCTLLYDTFYKGVMSAWWLYHVSRKIGNHLDWPSGSTSIDGMRALKTVGAVPWNEDLTPKDASCAPVMYPFRGHSGDSWEDEVYQDLCKIGEKHQVLGFAQSLDFTTALKMAADSRERGIKIAINLYEDFQELDADGCLRNHPDQEPVGSHDLWWPEADFDKGILYCRNSWDTDQIPRFGIRKNYFDDNAGPAFAVIDEEDTIIGEQLYSKVTVRSNVPCQFVINAEPWPEIATEIVTMLEREKECLITATPKDPVKVVEENLGRVVTPMQDAETVELMFTLKEQPGPSPTWPKWAVKLFEWLAKLFKGGYRGDFGNE